MRIGFELGFYWERREQSPVLVMESMGFCCYWCPVFCCSYGTQFCQFPQELAFLCNILPGHLNYCSTWAKI